MLDAQRWVHSVEGGFLMYRRDRLIDEAGMKHHRTETKT